MAFQAILVAMIGEGNVARLAFGDVATLFAHHRLRIPPTVQKQNRLFIRRQTFFYLLFQRGRKRRIVASAHLATHIRDQNFGQRFLIDTLIEAYEGKFPLFRPFIRFHRRRCATEHELTAVAFGAEQRYVERVIPRCGFACIA